MNPADFAPGTPKFGSKQATYAFIPARRAATAPRDTFRTTTRELTAEEQSALLKLAPIEIKPRFDDVPDPQSWEI